MLSTFKSIRLTAPQIKLAKKIATSKKPFVLRHSDCNATIFATLEKANLLTAQQRKLLFVLNRCFAYKKDMFYKQENMAKLLNCTQTCVSRLCTALAAQGVLLIQKTRKKNKQLGFNLYRFNDQVIGDLYRLALTIIKKAHNKLIKKEAAELQDFIESELHELATLRAQIISQQEQAKKQQKQAEKTAKKLHIPPVKKLHTDSIPKGKGKAKRTTVKPFHDFTVELLEDIQQALLREQAHHEKLKRKAAYQAGITKNQIQQGLIFSREELKRREKEAAQLKPQINKNQTIYDKLKSLTSALGKWYTTKKQDLFSVEQAQELVKLKSKGLDIGILDNRYLDMYFASLSVR